MTDRPIVSRPVVSRPVVLWDIALSITLLVIGGVFLVVTAVIDVISAALLSSCSPRTCSPGAAVAALGISWFSMFVLLAAGAILTILRLAHRRRGWWMAVATVVVIIAVGVAGIVLSAQAAGAGAVPLSGVVALGTALLG